MARRVGRAYARGGYLRARRGDRAHGEGVCANGGAQGGRVYGGSSPPRGMACIPNRLGVHWEGTRLRERSNDEPHRDDHTHAG